MRIENVNVYGVEESIIASGLPKVTKVNDVKYSSKRAELLGKAKIGSGHDNFLNGIVVQFDLIAPQYFWQQLQRYHFIDFVSSMSKMHVLTKLDLEESCNQYVHPNIIAELKKLIDRYNNKEISFEHLVSNVPMGLEMGARMTTNYRQLKTIYAQRKHHKLEDWKVFCEFIDSLEGVKELGVTNGD